MLNADQAGLLFEVPAAIGSYKLLGISGAKELDLGRVEYTNFQPRLLSGVRAPNQVTGNLMVAGHGQINLLGPAESAEAAARACGEYIAALDLRLAPDRLAFVQDCVGHIGVTKARQLTIRAHVDGKVYEWP